MSRYFSIKSYSRDCLRFIVSIEGIKESALLKSISLISIKEWSLEGSSASSTASNCDYYEVLGIRKVFVLV